MKKEDFDLIIETSEINFNNLKEVSEYREGILWDYIYKLQNKISELEEISKDDDFTMELMLAQISDLAEGSTKTCKTCAKKLLCEMAQKSKDTFGTKLSEQWFICYIPEE